MALSRFAFMPPELKIMTYYEFDPLDLLSVSHVSKFWRSLALEDKRWDAWFDKVAHPKGETAEHLLARYKLAGSISKRAIVTLCFYTKCAMCPEHTWDIFLPLLKRLCRKCLDLPEHAVISFSSALATYDLKERDIGDALVVHWEETDPEVKKKLGILYRAKLMSESVVKQIAIKKYGGEANMTTHLEAKKAAVRISYEKRLLEYKTAHEKRVQLQTSGNVVGAAMVGMGKNNKKMTKAPPVMPAILKNSSTPSFLRRFALFSTNYLSVENGLVVPRPLNRCVFCVMIENLKAEEFKQWTGQTIEPKYPGPLPRALLALHEQHEHHGREGEECLAGCEEHHEGRCETCLNASALFLFYET